jgi:catalase
VRKIYEEGYLYDNKSGGPVSDNQNSLTVGERGPALLQDVYYFTKADPKLGKRIADGLKL